jgi:hypothetical protein
MVTDCQSAEDLVASGAPAGPEVLGRAAGCSIVGELGVRRALSESCRSGALPQDKAESISVEKAKYCDNLDTGLTPFLQSRKTQNSGMLMSPAGRLSQTNLDDLDSQDQSHDISAVQ